MLEKYRKEKEIINSFKDVEIIKEYNLINNYGYIIRIKDFHSDIDIRHWLNMYGAEVNYWDALLRTTDKRVQDILNKIVERLDKECR